ncbi:MAG: hypothetical protein JO170_30670 [Verrucomicrobia bacterium]|nr:hypothetical protein [Verrucomicrobiota bacterium]
MSINTFREVVEVTEEFGGSEVRRVPLGTFAGTQYRLFVVPGGESEALDTGDQGGGQN